MAGRYPKPQHLAALPVPVPSCFFILSRHLAADKPHSRHAADLGEEGSFPRSCYVQAESARASEPRACQNKARGTEALTVAELGLSSVLDPPLSPQCPLEARGPLTSLSTFLLASLPVETWVYNFSEATSQACSSPRRPDTYTRGMPSAALFPAYSRHSVFAE